jgi:hypothetical protein
VRTIIAGGRDFNDYMYLDAMCQQHTITTVISGMAAGADTVGLEWARDNKLPVEEFPANWKQYGKSAGFRRNVEMAHNAT